MNFLKNRKSYKKIALALSLCLLIVWALLGTGTSLAWFSDTSADINNIFHFADFDVEVFYQLADGGWDEVDSKTKLFDEEALYEPGYVQVVYLKVRNAGSRAFQFKTAVNVTDYDTGENVYKEEFNLQNYLKFGLVTADTEEKLKTALSDREKAKQIAVEELKDYSTQMAQLEVNETEYIALIVRMPEEVGNDANYRGSKKPSVELGVIVTAEQIQK